MPLQVEERAERLRELLQNNEVREAMRERCDEQGHDFENCCSAWLEVYQRCKWCGQRR